jgi:hypothetical protein
VNWQIGGRAGGRLHRGALTAHSPQLRRQLVALPVGAIGRRLFDLDGAESGTIQASKTSLLAPGFSALISAR